jgi:hypothetical protein
MATMELIDCGKTIDIPPEVARCPYCDERLFCQPTAWEQDDDGSWYASESGLECWSEPDIDDEEWLDWCAEHTSMPYVYWLPVDMKVIDWLKTKYRFKCD